jgi:hypothetical protein
LEEKEKGKPVWVGDSELIFNDRINLESIAKAKLNSSNFQKASNI